MSWLNITVLASAAVFFIVNILRGFRIARSPIHLRWELYPVPHEKGKAHYGGSRLEEYEWWNKKQKKDFFGEFKVMAKEILLLSAVRENNRKLWKATSFFHSALYLYILNIFLLIVQNTFSINWLKFYLEALIAVCSLTGSVGAFLLLYRRLTDKNYRYYNNASHFFNIIVIGSLFVTLGIWFIFDPDFVKSAGGFIIGLLNNHPAEISTAGKVHIIIASFLLIYIPFTHMTHFFTKYFLYHKVRWDDTPNSPGSKIERKIASYLNLPVTWSAPHIGADGKKTWADIAFSSLPEGEKDGK